MCHPLRHLPPLNEVIGQTEYYHVAGTVPGEALSWNFVEKASRQANHQSDESRFQFRTQVAALCWLLEAKNLKPNDC